MLIRLLCIIVALATLGAGCREDWLGVIHVDDRLRTFYVHQPPDRDWDEALPLVIVLHGLGGDGLQMKSFTGFDDLADLILADPIHDVEETAGWPLAAGSSPD